ncbi:heterogeneous nuclear ribonucleoprotein U-like protein 2 isoform X1 [Phyllopteryx taeniolatus]|uniref:heterogeneous nuclear ribonucleoprotein U-like protein 2 isoform X1 n=1 Tax=Phyllopteryx taeniolatus TaxID=161469 RepID=UPI002AD30DC4|nr:heterogeneous nuclear ribonucleoprotein U-like protein 2 isoform X1 [Phyllopteryx taeniolatus]
MKLADIKKLKVAELRSRLNQSGLDSRGLKTDLVERLWSLLDDGGQKGNAHEQDVQRQVPASSLAVPASTSQTRDMVVELVASSSSLLRSSSPAEPVCINPADRTREFSDSATQTEAGDVSGCLLPDAGECQAEKNELEQPAAEEERGRAFYEFKEEIRYKRAKPPQAPEREETEEEDGDTIKLNSYDSHLHFQVDSDGACGQPRFWDRFPLLWSGGRLTHGVSQGRVGFEVRLEKRLSSSQPDGLENEQSDGVRVGWSTAQTSLLLGEKEFSFAYDGRATKVTCGREEEFGEPFCEGDIIGCYASFSTDGGVQLSFHKNGRFLGVAFSLEASELGGRALFPHVLCKSCAVRFLLDPTTPPWYPLPPGFTPLPALPARLRLRNTSEPSSRAQSEMLLMVGLPGSGKSHWARAHIQQHSEKNYKLLGTEELLSCMMSGGARERRLQQAAHCLTELIKMAAHTPGNYILDQCNILFSAQRYKLQLFCGFGRRVAVVLFPSADEWKRRLSERQKDGESIPETALLKLQVSCSLPEQLAGVLDELHYVELEQEAALALLREYKDKARRLLPPVTQPEKLKKYQRKKRPHPHGPPPPPHWTRGSGLNSWNNMQSWSQHVRTDYFNMARFKSMQSELIILYAVLRFSGMCHIMTKLCITAAATRPTDEEMDMTG